MPHYDYVCEGCGYQEEILQRMKEAPLTQCPQCLCQDFKRKIGRGAGLQFHGSGFYITDYGTSSAPASGQDGASSSSTSASPKGCGCNQSACSSA